jgi:hypothetical protein
MIHKLFIIFLLFLSSLLLIGCDRDIVYINKEVCRQPGTYCHVYIVDGGTVNISFPTVINGTFNYSVEGGGP